MIIWINLIHYLKVELRVKLDSILLYRLIYESHNIDVSKFFTFSSDVFRWKMFEDENEKFSCDNRRGFYFDQSAKVLSDLPRPLVATFNVRKYKKSCGWKKIFFWKKKLLKCHKQLITIWMTLRSYMISLVIFMQYFMLISPVEFESSFFC